MHEAREIALNLMFQVDVAHISFDDAAETAREHVAAPPDAIELGIDLAQGALAHAASSDALVRDLAPGWPAERQPNVDRNILRIAMFELDRRPETPAAVVMDEAIELAKKYSTEESGKFVNGVLAEHHRRRQSHTGARQEEEDTDVSDDP